MDVPLNRMVFSLQIKKIMTPNPHKLLLKCTLVFISWTIVGLYAPASTGAPNAAFCPEGMAAIEALVNRSPSIQIRNQEGETCATHAVHSGIEHFILNR